MSFLAKITFCFLLLTLFSCSQKEEIAQYAPVETYPSDSILSSLEPRVAFAITAHDDDLAIMAGTLSRLNKEGWEIMHVYFPHNDPKRKQAQQIAADLILDSTFMFDISFKEYRFDLSDGVKSWEPMPIDEFQDTFNYPLFESQIVDLINEHSPSVIFSLDSDFGGYGNPEHIFISKLVLDLAKSKKIKPSFIYQGVMTKHMERTIIEERHSRKMKEWGYDGEGWKKTRALYGVDGMPEPDVQVNIYSEAELKMKFLRSYRKRQRKTLGSYLPAFENYEGKDYFKTFDREFFRIIQIK